MSEIELYKTNIELSERERSEVVKLKAGIDLSDTNSLISYGAQPQRKSAEFMDMILSSVKTKELQETGELLNSLMVDLEGFSSNAEGNFLTRLFSSAESKIKKLKGAYTNVEKNIGNVVKMLESNRSQLVQSNTMLDKLYERSVECVNELKLYIAAGEEKVEDIRGELLPKLKAELEKTADELAAQRYRDISEAAERMEKKTHDLKLTKTVYVQSLPQIRLQQSANNVLIDKIQSSIVNAIPLWKSQMVIALGLAHTSNALKAQKAVADTTNELLRRNSELLKTSAAEAARENERSIVDIETVRKANEDIITTLREVANAQVEGRRKRAEAEAELRRLESELKENIIKTFGKSE